MDDKTRSTKSEKRSSWLPSFDEFMARAGSLKILDQAQGANAIGVNGPFGAILDEAKEFEAPGYEVEPSKHRVTFTWAELPRARNMIPGIHLAGISCTCGYTAQPARSNKGITPDDLDRVNRHFRRAQEKAVDNWVSRNWVTRDL